MENLILVTTGIVAALVTFIVNEKLNQGPVRASAIVSLVVGSFFYWFPEELSNELTQNIPIVFIGGSFIGMVSSNIISNYWMIGISGAIFSFFYLNASNFFNGYGGTLGTAACISLLVTLSLPVITKKHRIVNGFLILRGLILKRKK
ncbi:hypothetical protein AAG747_09215 [Rapidithrix thailandica]|uniref:Uncharacterized protein n=1 Tax=Rapidithrix thailandica TaxID=413964 RepID=A0AAW9S6S6_9BACT